MSEAIVSTVFRLINFSVICAIATYFIKKKLIPQTHQKIAAKRAVVHDLSSQNRMLLAQKKELEKDTADQELLGLQLFDQISLWSSSFEKQLNELQKEQQELVKHALQRARVQSQLRADARMRSLILSVALDGAQQELLKHFSSESAGQSFSASIIDRMRKEIA